MPIENQKYSLQAEFIKVNGKMIRLKYVAHNMPTNDKQNDPNKFKNVMMDVFRYQIGNQRNK